MKRILFYSENFCGDRSKGGLEVVTFRIARILNESGEWEVFNVFRNRSREDMGYPYKAISRLPKSNKSFEHRLKDFLIRNEIDVVVNMTRFFRHKYIVKAVKSSDRDIKIVFMQHFAPGSEIKKPTFSSGLHLLKLNPWNPLYWLRSSIYPVLKLPRRFKYPRVYRGTYNSSDKVILLSEGYKKDYCKIGGFREETKFQAIPNIFEVKNIPENDANNSEKKKKVLILSRMDEIQKRISLSLEIWAKIQDDPELQDWELDIVGAGHNSDIVKRLIKKLKLKRVNYHGWQPREKFLQESAILMSTAEYEGLPLALLEAQAYGVVPIAFDSYASLRDVLTHGVDGIVVDKFGDTETFSRQLALLMKDEKKLREFSENCRKTSSRFSSEVIGKRWLETLKDL